MFKQADTRNIILLILIFIAIYYPIFTTTYIFTDENVQLWLYGKQESFRMFAPQGRYVTEKMMQWSFGSIDTIHQMKWVRSVSFLGWLLAIPMWYLIIKKVVDKERLPALLGFWSTLYLICTPSLSISVVWASCIELFLANTAGLISGYCLYSAITIENGRVEVSSRLALLGIVCGVVALFTYQNGFGCFFIPFIIHVISKRKSSPFVWIGFGAFVFITVLYLMLFKLGIKNDLFAESERTNLVIAPWDKLKFFFSRPMGSSFHFTFLFNEKNLIGYIIYAILFSAWLIFYWLRDKGKSIKERGMLLGILFAYLLLTYLPSLLVRENYASNRTLLALKMVVFLLVAEQVLFWIKTVKVRKIVIATTSILFAGNAWYNVTQLFIKPVQYEYVQLKSYLERSYQPHIKNYYFIRPAEDFFVRKFGITRSWDEFGVPCSFFDWVPEFFVKQLIYEKTGDRTTTEQITVKHWLGPEAFRDSGEKLLPDSIVIDAEELMETE